MTRVREAAPETIIPGDKIQVMYHTGDVTHTRTGVVGKIVEDYRERHIETATGQKLTTFTPGEKYRDRIFLLKAAAIQPEPLFDAA